MQSSLFDKVASDLQLFKKDTPTQVSHGYCEIFINSFFLWKTSGGCFWQSCHSAVHIRAFTCSRISLKDYTKRWTNNSLLSRDKIIFFFLELIYHVLSISEYVLEKQLLSILMKNLHKVLHKEQFSNTCQKSFFVCTLQLINFRTWFRKRKNVV